MSLINPAIQALREKAQQQFALLGLPTIRHEHWKYTDISALNQSPIKTTTTLADIDQQIFAPYLISHHYLVFVNGLFSEKLSHSNSSMVSSLAKQMQTDLPLFLNQSFYSPALYWLNTANLIDGAYIYLSANTTLTEPLQLIFINTQESWAQPRNMIVLAPNTEASIVETYLSTSTGITNAVTEIQLLNNAKLHYYKLQSEQAQSRHISSTYVQQHAHSELHAHIFTHGAQLARTDFETKLIGENAHCTIHGLYIAQQRQHIDLHTLIDHQHPNTKSMEHCRGIANHKAHAVFNGKVIVRPEAQQTIAEQHNHNLLLSSEAEIDTKPELEIYANQVQCAHGATVGQIDEDALFYLRSRGLSKQEAQTLLLNAFAEQLIEKIPDASIQKLFHQQLQVALCLN